MRKWILIIAVILVLIIGTGVSLWVYFYIPQKVRFYDMHKIYTPGATGVQWFIVHGSNVESTNKNWGIKLPEIDFSKNYLLLSDGRKMKELTYTRISKYKWLYKVPKGVAVFDDEYSPNKVFVYVIDKILLKQDGD